MEIRYEWTNGSDPAFQHFYETTETYYSRVAGGLEHRKAFLPFNVLDDIQDVLIAYTASHVPVACASFRKYSETDAEIKRVWVEPDYRKAHIAGNMMELLEHRALEKGFKRAILQTREAMGAAVHLYTSRGYFRIENYPPYDKMSDAVCFAKELSQA